MKKIAILALLSSASAFADGNIIVIPSVPVVREHRVNFGLLNVGYERIKPDSVYVGVDAKLNPVWSTKTNGSNEYRLDHFINAEFRVGYNKTLNALDSATLYVGMGHTIYSLEKVSGNTKYLSTGCMGIKYLHAFGDTFKMGVHLKGSLGFSHQRYQLDDKKDNLMAVKVEDSAWIPEIGLPMTWIVGADRNWEIQFEPYYLQIPNLKKTHLLGSRLTLGYSF
jgi:hypothetical protein